MSSVPASSSLNVQSPMSPLDRITEHNSIFFLCDIQETFRGKIIGYDGVIATALFLAKVQPHRRTRPRCADLNRALESQQTFALLLLLHVCQASNVLGIPCMTTEQRPFKPTVAELTAEIAPAAHPNHSLFAKSLFSMLTPEVSAALSCGANAARRHVVLFGIETHVCVLQTTMDLLREGYHVHVVVDAVSSQNQVDRDTALARFAAEAARAGSAAATAQGAGVLHLTTAESVLFEIMRDAQHPHFKALLPALKELAKAKQGGVAPTAGQGGAKL